MKKEQPVGYGSGKSGFGAGNRKVGQELTPEQRVAAGEEPKKPEPKEVK